MTELNTYTLNNEELVSVNGGTFDRNFYSKERYHRAGVSTCYHFIKKDEFKICGRPLTYQEANDITFKYEYFSDFHWNRDWRSEYREYLKSTYQVDWDGTPGIDY